MSNADMLRLAADILEQRAEHATKSRWHLGLRGGGKTPHVYVRKGNFGGYSVADLPCFDDECEASNSSEEHAIIGHQQCDDPGWKERYNNAAYIASMDPDVGKSIAEWLRWESLGDGSLPSYGFALTVAHTVLREDRKQS